MKNLTISILIAACFAFGADLAKATDNQASSSPWTVARPTVIKQQDMAFTSAGAKLSGTLYYPEGHRSLAAVIVLHGASEPSRDSALYTHLKQTLPPLGVATFVFDRRGTGRSGGGEHGKEDFDVLSDDAVAAFRMLIKDPRIDPNRVGFWGLSQGGGLVLLAAKKEPRAAFAIAVSALTTTADVQMNFASANIMRIKGYTPSAIDQAIATRHAIDNYVRGKIDRATIERALDAAEHQPWFKQIYLSRGMIDDPDWRQEIGSDPLKALNGSRVPTLLIFGQEDVWVPVGYAINELQATRKLHPNVTTRVIAGATHEMMLGVDPKEEIDPAAFSKFAPNAPEYFGLMSAWLGERGIAKVEFK